MKVGTWFLKKLLNGQAEVWQQTENGPIRLGYVKNYPIGDEIIQRMNEPPTSECAIDHAVNRLMSAADHDIKRLNMLTTAVLAEMDRFGEGLTTHEERIVEQAVEAAFFKMRGAKDAGT